MNLTDEYDTHLFSEYANENRSANTLYNLKGNI